MEEKQQQRKTFVIPFFEGHYIVGVPNPKNPKATFYAVRVPANRGGDDEVWLTLADGAVAELRKNAPFEAEFKTALLRSGVRRRLQRLDTVTEPEDAALRKIELTGLQINIYPGLTILLGPSTSGKTTILSSLIDPSELISWNEPRLDTALSTTEAALVLAERLSLAKDVLAVDSVASPMYTGAIRLEKGLSGAALLTLSHLDQAFRALGKALIVTFAPSVEDARTVESMAKNMFSARASAIYYCEKPGTVHYTERAKGDRQWRKAEGVVVHERNVRALAEDDDDMTIEVRNNLTMIESLGRSDEMRTLELFRDKRV